MLLLSQGEGALETSMCVRYLVVLKNLKQIVIQPMNSSPISNGAHREVMLDEQNLVRVRSQAALLSGVEYVGGWAAFHLFVGHSWTLTPGEEPRGCVNSPTQPEVIFPLEGILHIWRLSFI